MEAGLRKLLSRKTGKSKKPEISEQLPDTFRQTSAYEAVPPGPEPTIGSLPFKPSLDTRKPRKSFSHSKSKSDAVEDLRQQAQNADLGHPRTAPGIKPALVRIPKPNSNGHVDLRITEYDRRSERGRSQDKPPRPRHFDILEYGSKHPGSAAPIYNEDVASRNLDLPRLFQPESSDAHDAARSEDDDSHGGQNAAYDPRIARRDRFGVSHEDPTTATGRPYLDHPSTSTSTTRQMLSKAVANDLILRTRKVQSSITPFQPQDDRKPVDLSNCEDAPNKLSTAFTSVIDQVIPSSADSVTPLRRRAKTGSALNKIDESPAPPPRRPSRRTGNVRAEGPSKLKAKSHHLGNRSLPNSTTHNTESNHPAQSHGTRKKNGEVEVTQWVNGIHAPPTGVENDPIRHYQGTNKAGSEAGKPGPRHSSQKKSRVSWVKNMIEPSGRSILDLTGDASNDSDNHSASGDDPASILRSVVDPPSAYAHKSVPKGRPVNAKEVSANLSAIQEVGMFGVDYPSSHSPDAWSDKIRSIVSRTDQHLAAEKEDLAVESRAGTYVTAPPIHEQVTLPSPIDAQKKSSSINPSSQSEDLSEPLSVHATPESLNSNDFINPTIAFGVTARDFAVTPTKSTEELNRGSKSHRSTVQARTSPTPLTGQPSNMDTYVTPPRSRVERPDSGYSPFDEEEFAKKQAEARAALLRLQQTLEESFAFPVSTSANSKSQMLHHRDLSLNDGRPITAPTSIFARLNVGSDRNYQSKSNYESTFTTTRDIAARDSPSPTAKGRAAGHDVDGPSKHTNSRLPFSMLKMTQPSAERREDDTPATPSISNFPLPPSSPASPVPVATEYHRSTAEQARISTEPKQPGHARVWSTTSATSTTSAYSVPYHMVPARSSSLRDSDSMGGHSLSHYHMDEASWE